MKTRFPTRVRWAVLVSATALTAAACANTSADDGAQSDPGGLDYTTRMMNVSDQQGEPVQGGTLRVSEYVEARTLDPTTTYPTGSTGGNIMSAIYDTLLRYDFESDDFEPRLAESVESSDDRTWTVTLRKGVKFHDGTPLDAESVVGSLAHYEESHGLNSLLFKQEVQSMKAVDPLTVEITLAHPWPRFPILLSKDAGMILAPAAYADPKNFKPIGAGPFTFESYAPTEKTVVKANDDYWGGRPHLDAIEFVLLGSDRTAFESLRSGGVDVTFLRNAELVDQAIEEEVAGKVTYGGLTNNLWINNRDGHPGSDQRVRKAMALAFDPEMYLQRTHAGASNPSKLLLGTDSKWSPGVEPMGTDPEAAKELLDEAKADGYDGKLSITARTDQESQKSALSIKAMLEAAGFEIELDLLQSVADQVQSLYVDHDYDIAISSTSVLEADIFGRLYSALNSESPSNVPGYQSAEMDELIRELQAIKKPADAKKVLTAIEELWAEEVPGIAISAGAMLNVWSDEVHGIVSNSDTNILFDDAWVER